MSDAQYITSKCEFGRQRTTQINQTLRDQFATAALQGMLSYGFNSHVDDSVLVATKAYRCADAMLIERDK